MADFWEQGLDPRLVFHAKRGTTGLTDAKITIWGPDGVADVTDGAMTELGNGLYYYDFTAADTYGTYIYRMTSATNEKVSTGSFVFKRKQAGTGGWIKETVTDVVWTKEEKVELLSGIRMLVKELKFISRRSGDLERSEKSKGQDIFRILSVIKDENRTKHMEYKTLHDEVEKLAKDFNRTTKALIKTLPDEAIEKLAGESHG